MEIICAWQACGTAGLCHTVVPRKKQVLITAEMESLCQISAIKIRFEGGRIMLHECIALLARKHTYTFKYKMPHTFRRPDCEFGCYGSPCMRAVYVWLFQP